MAIQLKIDANINNTRECDIHAKKNNNQLHTYNIFHINKIYFTFTRSFILHIGITNNSLITANIVQIAVTHRALPTISLIYIEKYVSVQSHHPIIKRAKDNEIDLIFTGMIFGNVFLIFFSIITLF